MGIFFSSTIRRKRWNYHYQGIVFHLISNEVNIHSESWSFLRSIQSIVHSSDIRPSIILPTNEKNYHQGMNKLTGLIYYPSLSSFSYRSLLVPMVNWPYPILFLFQFEWMESFQQQERQISTLLLYLLISISIRIKRWEREDRSVKRGS